MAMQWFTLYFVTGFSLIATISRPKKLPSISKDNDRIVGGELADIEDIPYQLSLHFNGNLQCGASIIGADWALCAAHCFVDRRFNMFIRAGSSFANSGGEIHKIEKIIKHPRFDYIQATYDIAVLKVSNPFQLGTAVVNCIPLATKRTRPGTTSQTSGWGLFIERPPVLREQLQKVVVPIISLNECKRKYERKRKITQLMICAGYPEGGKDACKGDSGGPLVTKNKLIGVVSGGEGCARPEYPGVYTNVYKLRKWILSKTGPLSCNITNHKC